MASSQHNPAASTVRGAQSIDRAIGLLQMLARHHTIGIPLQLLVEKTGLDRTTVYRIMSSLVETGMASRDPDTKLYRLGIETMALGVASLQHPPLVTQCLPMMKSLARQSGEHVFLVLRSGDYSHCLHIEEGAQPNPRFAPYAGSKCLLGMGTPSIAFLAQMSDQSVAAHYARHKTEYESLRMSEAKLQRLVNLTRELGYAQVSAQGLSGVGVRFPMGSCGDAALGIVTLASRMPRTLGPALGALLQNELKRFLQQQN